ERDALERQILVVESVLQDGLPGGHQGLDGRSAVEEGDQSLVVEVDGAAGVVGEQAEQHDPRRGIARISDWQDARSREADRRRIRDADLNSRDWRLRRLLVRRKRHCHVERSRRRATHALELTGRGAAVPRRVALLSASRLHDPVAASGELAVGGAVGVVLDDVAELVLAGITLLDAGLHNAVTTGRLLAFVGARSRGAVVSAVVAGLARVYLPVSAQLTLLLRPGAIGRHCQVVPRLGGAHHDAARKRAARTDCRPSEPRTGPCDALRLTFGPRRPAQTYRRYEAKAGCVFVETALTGHGLRQNPLDDAGPDAADGSDASEPRSGSGTIPRPSGRRGSLQRRRAVLKQRPHAGRHDGDRRRLPV